MAACYSFFLRELIDSDSAVIMYISDCFVLICGFVITLSYFISTVVVLLFFIKIN